MSQFGSGDLAGVIVQRDREFVGYAEGVIRSWDPSTFEHTINVRGTDLHDLDVAAGVEALTYQPGDVVLLTRWKPRSKRGSATYRIGSGGRIIRPGTGAAEQTIAFLRTTLAESLSAQIFADRISEGFVPDTLDEGDLGFTYSTAHGGPTITADISETGAAIVMLYFHLFLFVEDTSVFAGMSFAVSGATTLPALDTRALLHEARAEGSTGQHFAGSMLGASAVIPVTGLNPGSHTFTAAYRAVTDGTIALQARRMTVIAL